MAVSSHRKWLAGLIAGVLIMMGISMQYEAISVHPWVFFLIGIQIVSGLLISCKYTPWLTGFAILIYAVSDAFLGRSDGTYWLLQTFIETSGILLAGTLTYQVGHQLKQFEDAFLQNMTIRRGLNINSQQAVYEEMEREIRRARRYERPVSLVSFAPNYSSAKVQLHQYLMEMIAHLGRQILKSQIADLFATQTKANDIISYHNGKYLILLPETDKAQAEAMARRLNTLCENSLEISAHTETASFPSEEITLSGLIKRTAVPSEKEIQSACETEENTKEDFNLQQTV